MPSNSKVPTSGWKVANECSVTFGVAFVKRERREDLPELVKPISTNWNPSLRMPLFPFDFLEAFSAFSLSFFSRVFNSARRFSAPLCFGAVRIISSRKKILSSIVCASRYFFSALKYSGCAFIGILIKDKESIKN